MRTYVYHLLVLHSRGSYHITNKQLTQYTLHTWLQTSQTHIPRSRTPVITCNNQKYKKNIHLSVPKWQQEENETENETKDT